MTKADAARRNGRKGGRPPGSYRTRSRAKRGTPLFAAAELAEAQAETAKRVEGLLENPHGLTPFELLFVEAYCGVARFSAHKAFQVAGYKGVGSVARSNAIKILAKDRVQRAVADRLGARIKQLRIMDGDEALERISIMARGDIGQVLSPDDPLGKLPEEARLLIKSVRPTKFGRSIELYDALRAAEILAKAGGRLKETVHVESLEELIAASRAPLPPTGAPV